MPDTLEDAPPAAEKRTDTAGFRLAAFGAVLVLVLFAGYGIGRLNVGAAVPPPTAAAATDGHGHDAGAPAPHDAGAAAPHDDTGTAPHVHNADGSVTPIGASTAAEAVGGLTVTSAGLTLTPAATRFVPARKQIFTFKIQAAGAAPVTTFAVVHDKPLHLIVVRRDLSGFQHLHPAMAPDGTWSIPLTLAAPGSYRAIADFTAVVGGRQVPTTLGVDLTVAGDYAPVVLPAPARQAVAGPFQVVYEGEPRPGSPQPLLMDVTTQGRPATLEPYLGAYGHLVVLREGDLGYVHVHPETRLVDGKVKFWLAAPGPGRYRMFFDFQVAGTVHTAAWTAQVD